MDERIFGVAAFDDIHRQDHLNPGAFVGYFAHPHAFENGVILCAQGFALAGRQDARRVIAVVTLPCGHRRACAAAECPVDRCVIIAGPLQIKLELFAFLGREAGFASAGFARGFIDQFGNRGGRCGCCGGLLGGLNLRRCAHGPDMLAKRIPWHDVRIAGNLALGAQGTQFAFREGAVGEGTDRDRIPPTTKDKTVDVRHGSGIAACAFSCCRQAWVGFDLKPECRSVICLG